MSTITKEWLQQKIAEMEAARDEIPFGLDEDDSNTLAALRIALASLEAESKPKQPELSNVIYHFRDWNEGFPVERFKADYVISWMLANYPPAQSAPVSVPDDVLKGRLPDAEKAEFWFEHNGKILFEGVKFNNAVFDACRAAMLQGADGTLTNEGTIPVTQFKPVADLYGLTSPTGGETSFTFDAVEARDFIDGGWSCQEYVELERFQEAITNHTEDKLAMVNHSGDSNNMVEPVTTANELRDAIEIIRNSGIEIDAEKIFAERDALNSPVIPDGWVACSERMPEDARWCAVSTEYGYYVQCWSDGQGWLGDEISIPNCDVTHWMPLPAAPQWKVK